MYTLDVLVSGFPGKSSSHGGLGWSSVCLLRNDKRAILVETGPPAYIPILHEKLSRLGLTPVDISHVLITHLHWDHVGNFTMFPRAKVVTSETELRWGEAQPPGTTFVPDLHIRALADSPRTCLVRGTQEFLPGISALETPGHTPGHVAYFATAVGGNIIFAGDSVKNRYELATGNVDSSMNIDDSRASVALLKTMMEQDPSTVMIPGHDVPLSLRDGVVHTESDQRADLSVFLNTGIGAESRTII